MGGSSSSTTETSQTTYPKWQQDALAGTYTTGKGQLENFLRNPQYSVAGFTTDTLKGMDLARETAQQAYTAQPLQAPGNPNLTASTVDASMNPYLKNVGDTTLDAMRREYGNADAGLASKYAAGNMMGGSGEAIARGQAARGYNQNVAQTIAQIQSQGYDKAQAAALANAQMENQMKMTGADYGLKSTQVNDALRTTNQARQMSALEQLLRQGDMQKGQNQEVLDVPWTALERLLGITPKQLNSQTYSQKETENQASPIDTLTKGISALSGVKGLFGGV
jgi:hypothetical protein